MIEIVGIVVIIFGILQIILFFKIWGMTNDVARIVTILKEHKASTSVDSSSTQSRTSNNSSYSSPLG
jgi:hypothetical protein